VGRALDELNTRPETSNAPVQAPRREPPSVEGSADTGWIRSLAGEWSDRWKRLQNPHDLSGASLRR
jgi:hypothetical protein